MEWQAMATAPRDGSFILTYDPLIDMQEIAAWDSGKWANGYRHSQEARGIRPTHWMPLPAPPQDTP